MIEKEDSQRWSIFLLNDESRATIEFIAIGEGYRYKDIGLSLIRKKDAYSYECSVKNICWNSGGIILKTLIFILKMDLKFIKNTIYHIGKRTFSI